MIQQIFEEFPGYDLPVWSLNAAAITDQPSPEIIRDNNNRMGGALIMFLDSIGLGTNGPDYVLFHEYTPHIQFVKNLPQYFEATQDASRHTAGAFPAYFGRHARGAAIPVQNMLDFVKAASGFGNCKVDDPGHPGTPNLRVAAVAFAALQYDTAT
jgi:hypothetical protein